VKCGDSYHREGIIVLEPQQLFPPFFYSTSTLYSCNMPKNGKPKMHNKLMKAKEVFKSAPTVGKSKPLPSKKQVVNIKPIDAQLMQMREREMRKGKTNVSGKAAPVVKQIQLQPSILTAHMTKEVSQPAAGLSMTDLLLKGEGDIQLKDVPNNHGLTTCLGSEESVPMRKNMFAGLSDDDDDGNTKYQLKLQPSMLSSSFSFGGKNNIVQVSGDSDDDDL
jgi:hypothetical protein